MDNAEMVSNVSIYNLNIFPKSIYVSGWLLQKWILKDLNYNDDAKELVVLYFMLMTASLQNTWTG